MHQNDKSTARQVSNLHVKRSMYITLYIYDDPPSHYLYFVGQAVGCSLTGRRLGLMDIGLNYCRCSDVLSPLPEKSFFQ